MKVQSVFEKYQTDEERAEVIQKVYDNCWKSETVLFNALSKIAEICCDRGSTTYDKIDEMREISAGALEQSKQIGLTNPDLYGSMDRRNSLAKQMKLARMKEIKKLIKKRVVRKDFVL